MNLHEYQAKELLKRYNVPTQEGIAAESVEDAVKAYEEVATEEGRKICRCQSANPRRRPRQGHHEGSAGAERREGGEER